MPDYNTIFMNQSRAGTGLKRTFPYTSYMTGLAEYAGSQRLSELEQERINQTADQYKRELALQNKANDIAESQAKKGAIIQGVGTAAQIGKVVTDPNTKAGLIKLGSKLGIGGSSATPAFSSGADIAAGAEGLSQVGSVIQPVGEGLTYTGNAASAGSVLSSPLSWGIGPWATIGKAARDITDPLFPSRFQGGSNADIAIASDPEAFWDYSTEPWQGEGNLVGSHLFPTGPLPEVTNAWGRDLSYGIGDKIVETVGPEVIHTADPFGSILSGASTSEVLSDFAYSGGIPGGNYIADVMPEGYSMVAGDAVPGSIGGSIPGLGAATAGISTGLMKYLQTGDVGEGVSHGLGAAGGAALGQMLIPIPVVGGMIGAAAGNLVVDPIMKGASAVGDAVWEGVKDVGKGIGDVVSDVAHGVGDVVSGIGKAIGSVFGGGGGGCTLLSYIYGPRSKEVRYAKVHCCRYLSQETLLGYYTSAEWAKHMAEKYHLKFLLIKPAEMWCRYVMFKLGKTPKLSLIDHVFSEVAMWVFRRVHAHTTRQFIPVNTCLPIIQMRDAKEVM